MEVYPAPNAAVGIGEGLPDYATIVVEESSGGEPVRRRRIRQLLNVYETGVQQAAGTPYAEKSIVTTTLDDPFWQRRIAAAKTALFFIALEDTDGEAPVRAGLAEVVALLRGKEVGYDDLRAAVEHGHREKSRRVISPVALQQRNPTGFSRSLCCGQIEKRK